MDLIRHRMLLSAIRKSSSALQTIDVYNYDVDPQIINGTVLSGSYTELGSAGLKMFAQGSDTSSCTIGTYDLTGYSMLKVVGAKKDFNIISLYVAILNSAGATLKTLDLKSVIGSNSSSRFTVADGTYTTHYLSLSGISGQCSLKIYLSTSGTTQINIAAFRSISFIPGESPDPQVDRIVIEGTGDASVGWVRIDETKYTSDAIVDLAAGNHSFEGHAYSITYYGDEHHAPSYSDVISRSDIFTGSAKITITKTSTGGFFETIYYSITIDGGE